MRESTTAHRVEEFGGAPSVSTSAQTQSAPAPSIPGTDETSGSPIQRHNRNARVSRSRSSVQARVRALSRAVGCGVCPGARQRFNR